MRISPGPGLGFGLGLHGLSARICPVRRPAQGALMIIGHMTTTAALTGALRLTDWGLIRAQGPDATSFLQGQLTQDVAHLPADQARLAGYCSAKGRLLASFVLWRVGAETLLLACSADLLASTLKRLSMFVMRAKCKLTDVSAELALHGLVGSAAGSVLADGLGQPAPATPWAMAHLGTGQLIRLPDADGQPRWLLAQPAAAAAPALPALAADSWQWLEVQSAVARISLPTVELFVPQMINLELVGGVNFQKGCYPGQEVVARSQYRGTLKRRAFVFDADTPLTAGQEIFHSADPGQPAGQVVLAALRPGGGSSALVETKLAALDNGHLHAGSADGPLLTRTTLPYSIPLDQG